MRVIVLYLLVAGLCIYAWKDWFKSLCGLILLMAIMEHREMPRAILGIQGLNLWNVLFGVILLAWVANRRRANLTWDMPRHVNVLLLTYLGVILLGVLRAALDPGHAAGYPLRLLIIEKLIETIKWALPGVLLFDGCRSRRQLIMVLVCLLVMYLLIATQVARRLPPSSVLSAGGDIERTRMACAKIGYGACDMSAMLAGVSWGTLAFLPLVRNRRYRLMIWAAAGLVTYGQALTGGRAGYLAWGATGLVMAVLRWRKYLILAPVIVVLLPVIFPGAVGRMFKGFGQTDAGGQTTTDDYSVTSGRSLMWPRVIEKIAQSPVIGYGRMAMTRTGLEAQLALEGYPNFPHPHNIYLEALFDNGILGSLPIFAYWGLLVLYSARLFQSSNPLYSAVGGVALSLTLAQLFAGIGSQHVYPEVSTTGMWSAMFLVLRVRVEEERAQMAQILAQTQIVLPGAPVQTDTTPAYTHS